MEGSCKTERSNSETGGGGYVTSVRTTPGSVLLIIGNSELCLEHPATLPLRRAAAQKQPRGFQQRETFTLLSCAVNSSPVASRRACRKSQIYLERYKMRQPFTSWPFVLLALISIATPIYAQTSAVAPKPTASAEPFSYDVNEETTLSGTVTSVFEKPAPGMIMGSHLLVETSSGTVDASLGRFALIGKDALSVSAGQLIEATGVMKTLLGQQVFLVRTVKVNDQVYAIRNKRGLALSPQARERLRQSGQIGELL